MKTHANFASEDLVAHAAAWRLASLLLERPRAQWKREIKELAQEVVDPAISSCARAADEASEELYQRLFGPGGTVSPREVSYCGFEDPGQLMAALQGYYQAFSFKPEREESIDHIAVEAGFVGYLYLKEAYARMQENSVAANVTRSARERFVQQHLKRCSLGALEHLDIAPAYIRGVLSWITGNAVQAAENSAMTEIPDKQA